MYFHKRLLRITLRADMAGEAFSPNYHRWALRLMEYGMILRWRPGTQHLLADAPCRAGAAQRNGGRTLTTLFQGIRLTGKHSNNSNRFDGISLNMIKVDGIDNPTTTRLVGPATVAFTPDPLRLRGTTTVATLSYASEQPR